MTYLLVALLGGMLALWSSKRVRVWRMQRRFARGRAGEVEAAVLLEDRGYRLLDEQVTRTVWGHHDFIELPDGGMGWMGFTVYSTVYSTVHCAVHKPAQKMDIP